MSLMKRLVFLPSFDDLLEACCLKLTCLTKILALALQDSEIRIRHSSLCGCTHNHFYYNFSGTMLNQKGSNLWERRNLLCIAHQNSPEASNAGCWRKRLKSKGSPLWLQICSFFSLWACPANAMKELIGMNRLKRLGLHQIMMLLKYYCDMSDVMNMLSSMHVWPSICSQSFA